MQEAVVIPNRMKFRWRYNEAQGHEVERILLGRRVEHLLIKNGT